MRLMIRKASALPALPQLGDAEVALNRIGSVADPVISSKQLTWRDDHEVEPSRMELVKDEDPVVGGRRSYFLPLQRPPSAGYDLGCW